MEKSGVATWADAIGAIAQMALENQELRMVNARLQVDRDHLTFRIEELKSEIEVLRAAVHSK